MRNILGWSAICENKKKFEMGMDYLGLRLPNFKIIWDSMLVNMDYAFIYNLDSHVKILFKHMTCKARISIIIPQAPQGEIFMDWDVVYGNPIRDVNTQAKGIAYWELTQMDPKARKNIGTRSK